MASVLGSKWLKGVPIEVSSICYVAIQRKLRALGGEPVLRMAKSKAGPCVTDNGNFIIDCHFGLINEPHELNQVCLLIAIYFQSYPTKCVEALKHPRHC
eukprot:m.57515 g.57515  ORF g.57515 m.57515 type:complete len:99 (+) comp13733_c0_seq8:478-774(+)